MKNFTSDILEIPFEDVTRPFKASLIWTFEKRNSGLENNSKISQHSCLSLTDIGKGVCSQLTSVSSRVGGSITWPSALGRVGTWRAIRGMGLNLGPQDGPTGQEVQFATILRFCDIILASLFGELKQFVHYSNYLFQREEKSHNLATIRVIS